MTFELLPQDEPGNPLLDVPPGFTDALMQRIEDDQRRRRLRRRLAILLMAVCLVAAVAIILYMLRSRRADGGRRQGAVQTQPVSAAAPVQQSGWLVRASSTLSGRLSRKRGLAALAGRF